MFDDLTQIRHSKTSKQRWRAAAAVKKQGMSEWIRDTLNTQALEDLSSLRSADV